MEEEHSITILRYNPGLCEIWNEFVESSKNGTFLFNRGYMDYHSDRFVDNSFVFYKKDKICALFPANIREDALFSHQGLTYGGLITSPTTTTEDVLAIFDLIKKECKKCGINKIIYKPVPYIYDKIPAQEDLYALFRNNADLKGRNISSVVNLNTPLKFSKLRKRGEKKAENLGIKIKVSKDYGTFWEILTQNLKTTYNVSPVHNIEEMERLASAFPDNIKLWGAYKDDRMIAGVICYYSAKVIHCQYISASPEGKKEGALDFLFSQLLNSSRNLEQSELEWLDLGTSNEMQGRYLNEGLIHQKEGFGARGVCYDCYEMNLK